MNARLLRVAAADRQNGAMPSHIRSRPDADQLWAAFRGYVGLAWTGRDERMFVAAWDAGRHALSERQVDA